ECERASHRVSLELERFAKRVAQRSAEIERPLAPPRAVASRALRAQGWAEACFRVALACARIAQVRDEGLLESRDAALLHQRARRVGREHAARVHQRDAV